MTALSFNRDPVDAAVVAALEAPGNLPVHMGSVGDSDPATKVISASLPYVLFASKLPYGTSPRIGANRPGTTEFTLTYTNATDEGCKAVAVAVRALIDNLELPDALGRVRLMGRDEPVIVRMDQTWTRPGGGPLFFAVDRYFVA